MGFSTLDEWLAWISSIHFTEMDLGLERVEKVAEALDLLSFPCPLIIVGGTNGKGSTVAGLEALYQAAGFKTGTFTSPFLFAYNEQICVNGEAVTDAALCRAFEKIDIARADITLTPFEFATLAALLIFKSYALDVLILEVGLGGRLDAVNILAADAAVVTSIGIDHVEWLGDTREKIGYEKAGIFRQGKLAVCGDRNPPQSLMQQAQSIGALFYCLEQAFSYSENAQDWSWHHEKISYTHLPYNQLATQNMAIVLMVITLLQDRLPVSEAAIHQGLAQIKLLGRIQIMPGDITYIYDVSHNPEAVAWLEKKLSTLPCQGKTYAIFSMLADKDIEQSIKIISSCIDEWHVAALAVKRAASEERLAQAFRQAGVSCIHIHASIKAAHAAVCERAVAGDRVIVFGSFHTIAEVLLNDELIVK